MKIYGYARVSSADQNATRQLDALEKAGIARRVGLAPSTFWLMALRSRLGLRQPAQDDASPPEILPS